MTNRSFQLWTELLMWPIPNAINPPKALYNMSVFSLRYMYLRVVDLPSHCSRSKEPEDTNTHLGTVVP